MTINDAFSTCIKKNVKLFAMSENWGLQSTLENNGFYSVMKKTKYDNSVMITNFSDLH